MLFVIIIIIEYKSIKTCELDKSLFADLEKIEQLQKL